MMFPRGGLGEIRMLLLLSIEINVDDSKRIEGFDCGNGDATIGNGYGVGIMQRLRILHLLYYKCPGAETTMVREISRHCLVSHHEYS